MFVIDINSVSLINFTYFRSDGCVHNELSLVSLSAGTFLTVKIVNCCMVADTPLRAETAILIPAELLLAGGVVRDRLRGLATS